MVGAYPIVDGPLLLMDRTDAGGMVAASLHGHPPQCRQNVSEARANTLPENADGTVVGEGLRALVARPVR